jgi:membrane protein DedA with SNARE-associated domain
MEMSSALTAAVALGAVGVFLLMVPESACVPIPSEVTLMAAGFAVSQGHLDFWVAVAAATAGNLVGSLIAYSAGRAGLLRQLKGSRARRALARCERLLGARPERAVFVARLLPLARTFVSLPAGHARVPLGRFVVLTTAGCALWSGAFVAAGAAAGTSWAALSGVLGRALSVATVGAALIAFAWRRAHRQRSPARAEDLVRAQHAQRTEGAIQPAGGCADDPSRGSGRATTDARASA